MSSNIHVCLCLLLFLNIILVFQCLFFFPPCFFLFITNGLEGKMKAITSKHSGMVRNGNATWREKDKNGSKYGDGLLSKSNSAKCYLDKICWWFIYMSRHKRMETSSLSNVWIVERMEGRKNGINYLNTTGEFPQ